MTTLISGVICSLLGAAIWLYSGTFPELPEGYPGPSLFPRVIAGGLVLSGIALLVRGVRAWKRGEEAIRRPAPAGLLRLAVTLAAVALFPLMQGLAGTIAALFLVCLAVAFTLGVRPVIAVLTALASAAGVYLVFDRLLGVPL